MRVFVQQRALCAVVTIFIFVLPSAVSARQVNDLGPALAAYQQGDYQLAY